MTLRSDLIIELERALTDEAYDGGMGALDDEQFGQLVRTLARTAADVIEEYAEWEWMVRSRIVELDRTIDSPITDEKTARAMLGDPEDGIDRVLMCRREAGPWKRVDPEERDV
jgi:hypothetical protein